MARKGTYTDDGAAGETIIHCPECGAEIPVSQVLQAQIREELEQAARARERALDRREKALAAQKARLDRAVDKAVAERLEQELAQRLEAARAEERERAQMEREALQDRLETQRKQLRAMQREELELRRQRRELEERAEAMELDVQRRLDAERRQMQAALREKLETEQALKLREKEKQIADLRRALDDARRRSALGSQELQGEVLELDLEERLLAQFPVDRVEPVPKGMRGADIVHTVCNERGEPCGTIVWETKNTKAWRAGWLDKLRHDQRALGASVAVIVSVALPAEVTGFGRVDGVWVTDPRHWPALAVALREQLVQVAWARTATRGRDEKMAMLYDYLAGDEFRQRVETIVEAFQAMQAQIERERRQMMRHWAEREKQLERVLGSTTGMYGALQGIIGQAMPAVPALEVEPEALPAPDDESADG